MKTTIIALFVAAMFCFGLGLGNDRNPEEVASVSASIVPYAIGSFLLVADISLTVLYALWRLLF